ncbi:protein ABHD18 [Tachypleus tridentatus]|uniref:protein ABHD18 n=1 Tax=Tachypleus tridentatus TaxID=6853 RepID=UPI003FCFF56A
MSKLDVVYRSILLTKFFTKGWGNPEKLKRLFEFRKTISNRETCQHLVSPDYPVYIDKAEEYPQYKVLDGHFLSPLVHHLPGVVPKESQIARFQVLLPKEWPADSLRPVCLHLAGTGDHYFWRRRTLLARPLLKESGIASIILENPFYGVRKPKDQIRSSLHNVSDIFVMGGCLILESLALFHWCERQGLGPLGITGISMGGHMASISGSNWHKPLALVPCLSWTTASCVFTQGVMSDAIPWNLLDNQFFSNSLYRNEIWKMVHSPEQNSSFIAGCHFARTYPESVTEVKFVPAQNTQNSSVNGTSTVNNDSDNKTVTWYPHNGDVCAGAKVDPGRLSKPSKGPQSQATVPQDSVSSRTLLEAQMKAGHDTTVRQKALRMESLNFMRGIMDECTHLGNFSTPVDPTLAIAVAATWDAYVPREGITSLLELWPGVEVRYINCGHISAFLFNQGVFRKAITDALEKTAQKYHSRSILMEASQKNTVIYTPVVSLGNGKPSCAKG